MVVKIKYNVLICAVLLITIVYNTQSYEFSRDYFGVSFSPYAKDFEGDKTPPWNTYSMEDVRVMVKIVSTRFSKMATYSAGTSDRNINSTWDQGDGNAFVARAAALVNEEANKTIITMAQGVYQSDDPTFQEKEIQFGFDEIIDANSIWPGTVWGIIFYNLHATNPDNGQITLNAIRRFKKQTQKLGVKIGTRIGTCDQINGGEVQDIIKALVLESDYIMCNIHPSDKEGSLSVDKIVQQVGEKFWSFARPIKKLNPNIEVLIGDTGWPSDGISYSGTYNTLKNMRDFWYRLNEWAVANKIRVQVFEAFNEPWKTDIRKNDPKDPGGIYGSERHFGWWKLVDNNNITEETIVEKITEIQEINIWIWILVSIVIVLLICLVIVAFFYRQYQKQQRCLDQLAEADIEEFERGIPDAAEDGQNTDVTWNLPYNRDYELSKDNLVIDQTKLLGSGEFGMVYKGKVNSLDVAIKTTKPKCAGSTLKSLLSEIKTMIYIGKHENAVEFIGAYTAELRKGILLVIMEFCPGGSLEGHLRKIRENLNPTVGDSADTGFYANVHTNNPEEFKPKFLKWSHEIASGMEFLASRAVIHADLATRNVLLTANETAKITDFGLSRRLYEYTEYVKKNQEPLPWRWMSPESLHAMTFSTYSDVWSFGITLWEIFSLGDIPYPGLGWTTNFVDKLFTGMKPSCPKYANREIYAIMVSCWQIKPEARPHFSILKASLLALANEPLYSEPEGNIIV